MDLLDPSSGRHAHEFIPGILPNGLFWTMQLSDDAFIVDRRNRSASLNLSDHPLTETFQLGGTDAIAAQVNVNVLWRATGDAKNRGKGLTVDPNSLAAFTGQFAKSRCTARISGSETGFSFQSGELTAQEFFAQIGQESNGSFLSS